MARCAPGARCQSSALPLRISTRPANIARRSRRSARSGIRRRSGAGLMAGTRMFGIFLAAIRWQHGGAGAARGHGGHFPGGPVHFDHALLSVGEGARSHEFFWCPG